MFQTASVPQYLRHPNSDPAAGGAHSDLAPERTSKGTVSLDIQLINQTANKSFRDRSMAMTVSPLNDWSVYQALTQPGPAST